jgi:hypothetical protein
MDAFTPYQRVSYRAPLIAAGALIIGGYVANTLVTQFHPHQANPNDHPAVFAEYAASINWIWVHYVQFAAAAAMVAGFVVLYRALTLARSATGADHVALAAAITSGAAVVVLQAVDGVALKHTVDGWAAAPDQEKTARFADAETVRWLASPSPSTRC